MLRTAYGISYPPPTLGQDGPNLSPINGAPTSVTNTFEVQTGSPDSIQATVDNPFPFGINQPIRRNAPPSFFYGQPIFAMRVPGSSSPGRAAVERGSGTKRTAKTHPHGGIRGIEGLPIFSSRGGRLFRQINLNQLPEKDFSMGPAALLAQVPNPFFGTITTPGSPLSRLTVATGQLLLPYPQFGRVLALDPYEGKSELPVLANVLHEEVRGHGDPDRRLHVVETDVEHR